MNYPTEWKTYEEKQLARLERYQELAQKAKQQSQSAYDNSNRLSEMIPCGQPILVGHHSEKMHRRHIEKIHNAMNKSIELQDKAEYYEKKVEGILNNNAISSDDPEAVTKLKEKLDSLVAQREKYKEHNKAARKVGKDQLPGYVLQNLSGNIKSVKDRIQHLENLQKVPEIEEVVNGITLKVDKAENRVKLLFPIIPSEEVRTKLKSNGFHWSPYNKAWQRMISDWAISLARTIAQEAH